MKKYDEYKDSGVEWIGDVPKHWEVSRIKFLISHSSAGVWGEDEKNDENDIVCFRAADFDYIHGCLRLDKMTIRNIQPEQLRGRTLQHGDLLIEKSGGGDNAPVGRIVRYNYNDKATCSNFMHFIRVNKFNDGNYLFYYFYAMYANNVNILFFNQTTGIQNLKIGEYIGQMIYIPILKEQTAIAAYLDTHCAKIDNLISIQQKRIALLQELKQSVITHAVTKGLNPNVEMKQSGVEWIGDVPKHWEYCRFKDFMLLQTTASNSNNKIGLENIESRSGMFVYTGSEFEGNGIAFSNQDIIYGKLRPYLQKVWLATFEGNAVGDFFVFRMKSNSCPSFVKYLMLSDGYTKETDGSTIGAKMPRVSSDFILTMHYCLPPIIEQAAIASYLDHKCATIDTSISNAQHQIELLQEYKQSLITEVVTGKYKVC